MNESESIQGVGDPMVSDPMVSDRENMVAMLEDLVACGPVLATLPSRASTWSPEKRLAGAVLASALVEIRDHYGVRSHRNLVIENLRWVASDETEWPFSFVRLCQLFDLEPSWVRGAVERWISSARSESTAATTTRRRAGCNPGFVGTAHGGRRGASARRGVHAALA